MIRAYSLIAALLLVVTAGCGGGSSSYTIPASSELKPFQPPAEDELSADGDDGWDLSVDDEGDEADAIDDEAEGDALEGEDVSEPAASPKPITPDKKTPTVPTKER